MLRIPDVLIEPRDAIKRRQVAALQSACGASPNVRLKELAFSSSQGSLGYG